MILAKFAVFWLILGLIMNSEQSSPKNQNSQKKNDNNIKIWIQIVKQIVFSYLQFVNLITVDDQDVLSKCCFCSVYRFSAPNYFISASSTFSISICHLR